ncbi:replication initiator protein A [Romboutsia sp. MSSM.1001216sp_RTP31141st1_G3_RTP31141_220114]|uniref:replication initiator protein A n=1 Tax=unclassified Romboutsia TaxID=2626894 RepID=UPI0031B60663
MSYFTVEEDLRLLHIQIPKALLYEKKYNGEKKLSNDAKILYGFFLDRVSLSIKNGWFDKQNRLYIKCDQITMSKILGCSEKKARKIRDELVEFELLEELKVGQGKSNLLYPKKVLVTVSELDSYIDTFSNEVDVKRKKERNRISKYRDNHANHIENSLNGQNDRTKTVDNTVLEQSNCVYSNTDFSNTDFKVVVDDDKQTKLINLYKSFKLEKKLMPHTINLLKSNIHISLDVFEQIFISASEDSVVKKYSYIKEVIDKLNKKGITTLEQYKIDYKNYKESKNINNGFKCNSKKNSNKNKFDNMDEEYKTFTKYTNDELQLMSDKNKIDKQQKLPSDNDFSKMMYERCIQSNWNCVETTKKYAIDYAKANGLDYPKNI